MTLIRDDALRHSNPYIAERWASYGEQSDMIDTIVECLNLTSIVSYEFRTDPVVEQADKAPPVAHIIKPYLAGGFVDASLPYPLHIAANCNGYEGKWRVCGLYERGPCREDLRPWIPQGAFNINQYYEPSPINIAMSKSPHQVAKDILRRFMPEHSKVSAYVRRAAEDQWKRYHSHMKAVAEVAQIVGDTSKQEEKQMDHRMSYKVSEDSYYNEVTVSHGKVSCKIFDLTVTELRAIVSFLKKERGNVTDSDK